MKKYNTGIVRRVYRIRKRTHMLRIEKTTDGRFITVHSHRKLGDYPKVTYSALSDLSWSFKATGVARYTLKQIIDTHSGMS